MKSELSFAFIDSFVRALTVLLHFGELVQ